MNETMEEVDEETRLRARREMQRKNLKLKREQLKYHKIILESTQRQFFEAQKISFWDGDKDSGEWRSGVIQCSPVCEIIPYGESSTHKITGVIARLRESSPYFVLDECRIKRDECAFVGSKTSYFAVRQLTGFITFQGKEYVRLKWANKKREEWVERSEYIQERPSSERKRQKPEVLTSTKIGELSDNPSERKVNVDIVLSDKQEAYLKDIYQRMPTECEEFIERGDHKGAFDVALREICFARSVDFWTREVVSTYQTVIKNIYLYQGDIDGNLVDYLEIIEYEDNLKLYASVWQVDDDGEMVLTRNGKVAINKEPSSTLLRLLGNSLDSTVFLRIQHGTSRSLADAQELVHRQVLTKMNEDRPYFEARGAWKKVKGDSDYDGPRKLANLSLMWEKMVGKRPGIILECNGRLPIEMVKGVLSCVKAKPVKNSPAETKKRNKCGIESCDSFVHAICKSKKFCFKHANPEHKKRCIKCSKNYAQIGGGFCRGCFGGKQKAKEALKCVVCNLNAAHRIGGKCEGCLDVKCFDTNRKRMRKYK